MKAFEDNRDVGHFIQGERVRGTGNKTQAVYNPATGAVARQLLLGTAEDVNTAVASAKAAFPAWADTPPLRRARVMFKFLDLVHRDPEYSAPMKQYILNNEGKTKRQPDEVGA